MNNPESFGFESGMLEEVRMEFNPEAPLDDALELVVVREHTIDQLNRMAAEAEPNDDSPVVITFVHGPTAAGKETAIMHMVYETRYGQAREDEDAQKAIVRGKVRTFEENYGPIEIKHISTAMAFAQGREAARDGRIMQGVWAPIGQFAHRHFDKSSPHPNPGRSEYASEVDNASRAMVVVAEKTIRAAREQGKPLWLFIETPGDFCEDEQDTWPIGTLAVRIIREEVKDDPTVATNNLYIVAPADLYSGNLTMREAINAARTSEEVEQAARANNMVSDIENGTARDYQGTWGNKAAAESVLSAARAHVVQLQETLAEHDMVIQAAVMGGEITSERLQHDPDLEMLCFIRRAELQAKQYEQDGNYFIRVNQRLEGIPIPYYREKITKEIAARDTQLDFDPDTTAIKINVSEQKSQTAQIPTDAIIFNREAE